LLFCFARCAQEAAALAAAGPGPGGSLRATERYTCVREAAGGGCGGGAAAFRCCAHDPGAAGARPLAAQTVLAALWGHVQPRAEADTEARRAGLLSAAPARPRRAPLRLNDENTLVLDVAPGAPGRRGGAPPSRCWGSLLLRVPPSGDGGGGEPNCALVRGVRGGACGSNAAAAALPGAPMPMLFCVALRDIRPGEQARACAFALRLIGTNSQTRPLANASHSCNVPIPISFLPQLSIAAEEEAAAGAAGAVSAVLPTHRGAVGAAGGAGAAGAAARGRRRGDAAAAAPTPAPPPAKRAKAASPPEPKYGAAQLPAAADNDDDDAGGAGGSGDADAMLPPPLPPPPAAPCPAALRAALASPACAGLPDATTLCLHHRFMTSFATPSLLAARVAAAAASERAAAAAAVLATVLGCGDAELRRRALLSAGGAPPLETQVRDTEASAARAAACCRAIEAHYASLPPMGRIKLPQTKTLRADARAVNQGMEALTAALPPLSGARDNPCGFDAGAAVEALAVYRSVALPRVRAAAARLAPGAADAAAAAEAHAAKVAARLVTVRADVAAVSAAVARSGGLGLGAAQLGEARQLADEVDAAARDAERAAREARAAADVLTAAAAAAAA
jgi:hypothetical protein